MLFVGCLICPIEREDLEAVVLSEDCMWLADPKPLLDYVFLPHHTSKHIQHVFNFVTRPLHNTNFHTCISPYVTEYRYPSNPDMTWLKPAFAEVRHCLVLQGSKLALSGANCCLKFAPSNPQALVNVSSYVNFQLYPFFQPTHTLAAAAAAAKYKAGAWRGECSTIQEGAASLWCQHA